MQQVEMLVRFIARLIFKKDTVEYRIADFENLSGTDRLFNEINELLDEGRINEAEDLLFENIDAEDEEYLKLAADFYQRINRWGDDELEAADFSRDEIYSGLGDVMQMFGLPKFA